jgi:hypothetical protein
MDSKDVWKVVFAIGASIALILHVLLPRYEWRTYGDSGSIVVVYDRWSNFFQRAVYDEHGKVTPMDPFRPF